jgi:hypothetical protein
LFGIAGVIGISVGAFGLYQSGIFGGGSSSSIARNNSGFSTESAEVPRAESGGGGSLTVSWLAGGYWKKTCSDTTAMYFSGSTPMFELTQNGRAARGSYRLSGNTAIITANGRERPMRIERTGRGLMHMTFNGQSEDLLLCTGAGADAIPLNR